MRVNIFNCGLCLTQGYDPGQPQLEQLAHSKVVVVSIFTLIILGGKSFQIISGWGQFDQKTFLCFNY